MGRRRLRGRTDTDPRDPEPQLEPTVVPRTFRVGLGLRVERPRPPRPSAFLLVPLMPGRPDPRRSRREGLLLIVLSSLAGLAQNLDGEAAMTDGFVLGLGVVVLATVLVARRSLLVLTITTAAAAGAGFLVENALWIFAAAFLLAGAALGFIARHRALRAGRLGGTSEKRNVGETGKDASTLESGPTSENAVLLSHLTTLACFGGFPV